MQNIMLRTLSAGVDTAALGAATGDETFTLILIVGGVMVVALGVVVTLLVTGKKKRK